MAKRRKPAAGGRRKAASIRSRVRELRHVRAGDLYANPRNWRTHPKAQQDALRGLLGEIGYADALIVRELPDGGLEIIDGHLRAETTPDAIVPVLVLDVNEDEAKKLLTALDPMAAMAEANPEALASLLAEIETESEALEAMLRQLAKDNGIRDDADRDVHFTASGDGDSDDADAEPDPNAEPAADTDADADAGPHNVVVFYQDADVPLLCRFLGLAELPKARLGRALLERIRVLDGGPSAPAPDA